MKGGNYNVKNRIRSQVEVEQYMTELKEWLNHERDTPVEVMTDFFTNRLNIYENVHLEHWAKEYEHITDFFDNELHSLLDIGCDYIACCNEEERICLEQYEYKRQKNHIPDDVFVHIDIPLTLEHQIELMKNAGFSEVRVLYENCGTMIIRAEK